MNLILIIQSIINGLILGSFYVLVAISLSLIYGVLDVLNWAIGDFAMLGGYILLMFLYIGIPPALGLIPALVIAFIFGVFAYLICIRRLEKAEPEKMGILSTIVTFGLSVFLQNVSLIVFGPTYRNIPNFLEGTFNFSGVIITSQRLLNFIVSVSLTVSLWLFLKKTRTGMAIRAVAQNREAAALMGISTSRIYLITFSISSMLAAAAGMLLGPITMIFPTVGNLMVLQVFAVVVLGGLGSVGGAIFGGFLVGLAESFGVLFLTSSWKDLFAFAIIMIVLIIRPTGFFGVRKR